MVTTRRSFVMAFAVTIVLAISGCASLNLPNPLAGKEAKPAETPALAADKKLVDAPKAPAGVKQGAPAPAAKPAEAVTPAPAAAAVKRVYERVAGSCRPIIDLACGNVTPRPSEVGKIQSPKPPAGTHMSPFYVKKGLLSREEFINALEKGDTSKVLVSAEEYYSQLADMGIGVGAGGKKALIEYLRSQRVEVWQCRPDLLKGMQMGRFDPKTRTFDFGWTRDKCLPESQLLMDCDLKDITPPPPPPPAAAPAAKPAPAPVVSTTNGACTSVEREFHVNIFDEGKSPEIESCRKGAKLVLGSADSFSTACTIPLLRKEMASGGKHSWRVGKPFVIKVSMYDPNDPKAAMTPVREVRIENGYGVFSETYASIKGKALQIAFPSQDGFKILSPVSDTQLRIFPKEFEGKSCAYQFSATAKAVEGKVAQK